MIWGAVSWNNAFSTYICPTASFFGHEGDPSIYNLFVTGRRPATLVRRMGCRSAGRMHRYTGSPFL